MHWKYVLKYLLWNKFHVDDFFWETRLGNKLQTLLLVINRIHVPLTFYTVPHIPVSFVQVFYFNIMLSWVGLFGLSSSCLTIGSHIGPALSLQLPQSFWIPHSFASYHYLAFICWWEASPFHNLYLSYCQYSVGLLKEWVVWVGKCV